MVWLKDKKGRGANLQPRILYPIKLLFRINGEIKSFTDEQKLRQFSTTKPALQQILKEFRWKRKRYKKITNGKAYQ